MASEVIYNINTETYAPRRTPVRHICKKLSISQIYDVQWLKLSNTRHYYKLVLGIDQHPTARFEAVIMVSSTYIVPRSFE